MRKFFLSILEIYDYTSFHEVWVSLFPSFKYHLTFFTLGVATALNFFYDVTGLGESVAYGFVAIMVLELVTGLAAATFARKEKFSKPKLFRFLFKMCVYVVLISATYHMSLSSDAIISSLFSWLKQFIIVQITIENLYSVLENLAKLYGEDKHLWIAKIKEKVNDLLK